VIILVGIPGSGKSTWAKQQIIEHPNTIRVNRDDFRLMLKNNQVVDYKVEKLINKLQRVTIIEGLKNGFNVIVDNTNLKAKYIDEIFDYSRKYANITILSVETPLEECIKRDSEREKPVGEEIIKKMHRQFIQLGIIDKDYFYSHSRLDRLKKYIANIWN